MLTCAPAGATSAGGGLSIYSGNASCATLATVARTLLWILPGAAAAGAAAAAVADNDDDDN